ncbi:MAG: RidA family protein [Rhodospirillales bacterium]|nr:RidA family protein [Rhodospirillales bacterium]
MFTAHNPPSIAAPASAYAQGLCVEGATRWLTISGQVGALPDGGIAGNSRGQMQTCWDRIFAVLEDAGMTKKNIVKVTVYLTRPEDVTLYREIRDTNLEGHIAASTLLLISGLADPDWLVEIEAIAAA